MISAVADATETLGESVSAALRRRATDDFSPAFQGRDPKPFYRGSRSAGWDSIVANATTLPLLTLIPALKRRAKIMPTLRVEELAELITQFTAAI
jgi:hypothetical protein